MNIFLLSPRAGLSTIAGLALTLVGAALWLQHAKDMAPCPLCALQRNAFVGGRCAAWGR